MKQVIVHIGPHKTGSTFIQNSLNENADSLKKQGVRFLHDSDIHGAAMSMVKENYKEAEEKLKAISRVIGNFPEEKIILSQEDFSGDLVGRTLKRKVYPKLTKNIRVIARSLRPHRVKFVFFVRDEDEWIRSCYVQHLKFRTKFFSLNDFRNHYDVNFRWNEKLEKPAEAVGNDLVVARYSRSPNSGLNDILSLVSAHIAEGTVEQRVNASNISPGLDVINKLERINRLSDFPDTAWFSKKLVLEGWKPSLNDGTSVVKWPNDMKSHASGALPVLWKRVMSRVSRQSVKDILPNRDANLISMASEIIPSDVEFPSVPRYKMEDQSRILEYHLRGKSRLAHLNALVISYLRRDTRHSQKACYLFHRIWEEMGVTIVNELSTRWLISTLQTFLDHGKNEHQRLIGGVGYFYANMMKIYEGERAIEGLDQDAIYEDTCPKTRNKFRGLDRYNVGGTDLMLNTNALALEISGRDDVAGLVFQEFLLRVKSSGNVFTRLDKTRCVKGIEVSGFQDTWSFFDKPC